MAKNHVSNPPSPSQILAHSMENLDISQWKSGEMTLHPNQTVAVLPEEFMLLAGNAWLGG